MAGSGDRERLLAPAAGMQLGSDRQRADGFALDVAHAHTHANAKTQFSASQCCDLFRLPFFLLFNAAPCPHKARERFMRGVAKEPLGRTVDAARLWPEHRYNMRYNMQLAGLECKT